jgi:hypothetical protein
VAINTAGQFTELASITVPAGSYLLGATLWASKPASGGTSQVICQLKSSDTPPNTYWAGSQTSLLTDTSPHANLSLNGADTFTAAQVVKVFCRGDSAATNVVDVRLWAIKTGSVTSP